MAYKGNYKRGELVRVYGDAGTFLARVSNLIGDFRYRVRNIETGQPDPHSWTEGSLHQPTIAEKLAARR